ncbi:MAG: ribosome maturation factor RimP [Thermodesulfobacteriota bacterium]|nr:ribosome maturation factor RimP [Thermodesulfobacteriota bacterium]
MTDKPLKERLRAMVSREVSLMGLDLVDLELLSGMLRITIDKPDGVSMDDCVSVNKRIGMLIDADDPISGSYRLEVSSPGLNRKLKTRDDYERSIHKMVKVVTHKGAYRGELKALNGSKVVLAVDGSDVEIQMSDIIKARLDFDF